MILNFNKVDSSIETGIYSYMGLCELTSNKFMKYFIKINYVLNNWGYIITYIVLVIDIYLIGYFLL
jgi:hypothetical protein